MRRSLEFIQDHPRRFKVCIPTDKDSLCPAVFEKTVKQCEVCGGSNFEIARQDDVDHYCFIEALMNPDTVSYDEIFVELQD